MRYNEGEVVFTGYVVGSREEAKEIWDGFQRNLRPGERFISAYRMRRNQCFKVDIPRKEFPENSGSA